MRSGSIHTGLSWFDGFCGGDFPSRSSSRFRNRPRPASRFTRSRHRDVLWSARYPCQISVSDSPPRVDASRCSGCNAHRCGQISLTSPCRFQGVSRERLSRLPTAGRVLWFLDAAGALRRAVVCTLPLSGVGLRQTAGALASRCAGDHARQGGQLFVGNRLHPHRPFLVQLLWGWPEPLLTLAVPRSFPGPSRFSRSRDTSA